MAKAACGEEGGRMIAGADGVYPARGVNGRRSVAGGAMAVAIVAKVV